MVTSNTASVFWVNDVAYSRGETLYFLWFPLSFHHLQAQVRDKEYGEFSVIRGVTFLKAPY